MSMVTPKKSTRSKAPVTKPFGFYVESEVERFTRFCFTYLRHTSGPLAGEPVVLSEFQIAEAEQILLVDIPTNQPVYEKCVLGLPRGNAKSMLGTYLALYWLLASHRKGHNIYAAAASQEQARIVFREAVECIEASPLLSTYLVPRRSHIECPGNGGMFRVLTSKGLTSHGLRPYKIIADELHAWTGENLEEYWRALTTALPKDKQSQLVVITTAGYDRDSILYDLYEIGQKLKHKGTRANPYKEMVNDRFYFSWYQAKDGCKLDTPLQIQRAILDANPAPWIDPDRLIRDLRTGVVTETTFRQLHLNQWVEAADIWLPAGAWEKCRSPEAVIPDGADVFLGVDIGHTHDRSAIAVIHKLDDKKDRSVVEGILLSPNSEAGVPLTDVEHEIRKLADKYNVLAVGYDKWHFRSSAERLSDEGLFMVEQGMDDASMIPATTDAYTAICQQRIIHNGDPVLAADVKAGALSQSKNGVRLSKGKKGNPMDLCMAMVIAHRTANGKVVKRLRYFIGANQ